MKTRLLVLFAYFLCATASAQISGTHTKKSAPSGAHYWEYLPPSYDASGSTKYPVMFFLHGCGEIAFRSGGNCPPTTTYASTPDAELDKVLANGPPKLIKNGNDMCFSVDGGPDQCFVVISPQLNNGLFSTSWEPRKLDTFIEEIKTLYPSIDTKRIYLTGLSWGGIGTWKYAERHPDKLAAIVPISGNASGDPVDLTCNLRNIPVWAFHDDPDGTVATGGTTTLETRINTKCGTDHLTARVTLIKNYEQDATGTWVPNPTHSAWNTAYNLISPSPADTPPSRYIIERPTAVPDNFSVYQWMLGYTRTLVGPIVNVEADKTVTTSPASIGATSSHPEPGSWVVSYLWEIVSWSADTPAPTLSNETTATASIGNLTNTKKYTLRCTVTDNHGYRDTDEVIITANVPASNNPPTANAGNDVNITLPQNSVILSGSGVDTDGTITSYAWTKVSGGTATITNGNTQSATITNLAAGSYTFRFTVTDNAGATGSDDVVVTVSSDNIAPTANAGTDINITTPQSSVTLSGSGTDPDGTIASYSWTQLSGSSATITGGNTQTPVIGGLALGTYSFRLTVTDNGGATGSDDVTVTVTAPSSGTSNIWNSYDIVMQSSATQQGVVTSVDGSSQATLEFYQSTDLGGVTKGSLFTTFNTGAHPQAGSNLATYWANGTGNVYPHAGKSTTGRGSELGEANAPTPTGVFDLQLHPPNANNLCVAAFIAPANGDYSISNVGVRRVLSTGSTSSLKVFDKNKTNILTLQALNDKDWIVNSGSLSLGALVAGDRIYFAVDRDGNYASDFTEVAFTITRIPPNAPPIANAGADVSITLPQNSVTVSGTGTDSDGAIASYQWTQVAGASATIANATGQTTTISGLTQGSYTFRLTVADDDGATASDDVDIVVNPQPISSFTWNSYDIVIQSNPLQQAYINSTDGNLQASLEFYQSTDIGGVAKGSVFSTFNPGAHPQTGSNESSYWANGTGNVYPHAGKSTTGRGSELGEANAPQPTGVFDLQLHPPNLNNLVVAAFIVPQNGDYTLTNLGVRRVLSTGTTSTLKVFNNNATLIASLQAINNKDWVLGTGPVSLGTLTSGSRIYFAVDRDGNYASDFTEVAFTVTLSTGGSGRIAVNMSGAAEDSGKIQFYPNPVQKSIHFDGIIGEANVTIYNSVGTMLQQNKIDQNNNSIELKDGTYSHGFYIMSVESRGTISYHKFLRE